MPSNDQLDADLLVEMAQAHFRKLASFAIQAQGAAEMGRIYARQVSQSQSEMEKQAVLGGILRAGKSLLKRRPPVLKGGTWQGAAPDTFTKGLVRPQRSGRVGFRGAPPAAAPTKAIAAPAAAPTQAVAATPAVGTVAKEEVKRKGMRFGTKAMIGISAVAAPTVYLGGKALDTTKAALNPGVHTYGQGAPMYQNRSWGM